MTRLSCPIFGLRRFSSLRTLSMYRAARLRRLAIAPTNPRCRLAIASLPTFWCRNRDHAPCPYTGKALPIRLELCDRRSSRDRRTTGRRCHISTRPRDRGIGNGGRPVPSPLPIVSGASRSTGTALAGRFSHDEGRYLARVAPRFGRIVELAEKLEAVKVASALTAFDQLKCPALMIDWRWRRQKSKPPGGEFARKRVCTCIAVGFGPAIPRATGEYRSWSRRSWRQRPAAPRL